MLLERCSNLRYIKKKSTKNNKKISLLSKYNSVRQLVQKPVKINPKAQKSERSSKHEDGCYVFL